MTGSDQPRIVDNSSPELWSFDLFQHPLDVDWRKEGDEWVDHLFASLREEIAFEGRSEKGREAIEAVPYPHLEYTVASEELTSALRLVPLEQGIYAFVTGEGDGPSATEIEPWSDAIEAATERVGRSHMDFRWSAIIGPLPGLQEAGQFLEEPAEIGGLSLRSGGVVGRIIGVDAGCAVVAVSEPLLDRAERCSCSGHPRPEGVTQIMKPYGPKSAATRRFLEPPSHPRRLEDATTTWVAEDEIKLVLLPRPLLMLPEFLAQPVSERNCATRAPRLWRPELAARVGAADAD